MGGAFGLSAAVLLVFSGCAKLRTPAPTRRMLTQLLGSMRAATAAGVAVAAGVAEVVLGALFIAVGGRLAAAGIAALYLCFTGVSLVLLRRDEKTSCGCFGRSDAPVGLPHVALNVAATLAGVAAVIRPVGSLGGFTGGGGLRLVTGVAQTSLLAMLGLLCITALPELNSARREVVRLWSS
jgi:hypothetical protein